MKTLKFLPHLVPLILSGEKTTTWRLFDDKDLKTGDEVALINKATGEEFSKATLSSVVEKKFSEMSGVDMKDHEKYADKETLIKHFQEMYGDQVTSDTAVKIITFRLVQ